MQQQLQGLDQQVQQLEAQQEKLVASERQLSAKIEAFRSQKEVIKAQYSAAEAQVRIGEAATGIGEQMADTGLAIQRAKDKTEQMQARAAAVEELVEAGTLEDFTVGDQTQLDRELAQISPRAAGRRRARADEGRARRRREAEGDRAVIVRLMGEGQYRVDDELPRAARTSSTTRRWRRSTPDDEEALDALLDEMWQLVRDAGRAAAGRRPLPVRRRSSRRAT